MKQSELAEGAFDRLLNEREVRTLTGLSRVTIWRLERVNRFPARLAVSSGRVAWRLSDLCQWMADLPAAVAK